MKKFISEFREFAVKGNVLDMAVGIIIGSAFSSIVTSLVNDLVMPIVGIIVGKVDFSTLSVKVGESVITYGKFIQSVFNFLVIAFSIFVAVKAINKMKKHDEPEKVEEPEQAVPEDIILLTEIRDALKK